MRKRWNSQILMSAFPSIAEIHRRSRQGSWPGFGS
jgi:hypothetical protein